jgi:hypothetical protein
MKRSGGKPVPITHDEFDTKYRSYAIASEYEYLRDLDVGQGYTFTCRWKHTGGKQQCNGRQFFRYAMKKLGIQLRTRHGLGTISVLRDK